MKVNPPLVLLSHAKALRAFEPHYQGGNFFESNSIQTLLGYRNKNIDIE